MTKRSLTEEKFDEYLNERNKLVMDERSEAIKRALKESVDAMRETLEAPSSFYVSCPKEVNPYEATIAELDKRIIELRDQMSDVLEAQRNADRGLTFKFFSQMNRKRKSEWHERSTSEEPRNWGVVDWSNAAAGEMGECCNAVKKFQRMLDGIPSENNYESFGDAQNKIAEEIAGAIAYLDLLANEMGLDLETIIRKEFNRISEREKLPYKL